MDRLVWATAVHVKLETNWQSWSQIFQQHNNQQDSEARTDLCGQQLTNLPPLPPLPPPTVVLGQTFLKQKLSTVNLDVRHMYKTQINKESTINHILISLDGCCLGSLTQYSPKRTPVINPGVGSRAHTVSDTQGLGVLLRCQWPHCHYTYRIASDTHTLRGT